MQVRKDSIDTTPDDPIISIYVRRVVNVHSIKKAKTNSQVYWMKTFLLITAYDMQRRGGREPP